MNEKLERLLERYSFDDYAVVRHGERWAIVLITMKRRMDMSGCEGKFAPLYFTFHRAYLQTQALTEEIAALGWQAECASYSIKLKPLAKQCGIGFIGYNTLCVSPKYGCDYKIDAILTDMPLCERVFPEKHGPCASCGRCVAACPTGALTGEGGFVREKCLRNHQISGKPVPEEYRPLMGDMMLGCTACQTACPFFKQGRQGDDAPEWLAGVSSLADMLSIGAESPWRQIRRDALGPNFMRSERLCAQALLVAANTGRRDLLPLIRPLAAHENPVIAEHARWALGRLEAECAKQVPEK